MRNVGKGIREDGNIVRVIGALIDISTQKHDREELETAKEAALKAKEATETALHTAETAQQAAEAANQAKS